MRAAVFWVRVVVFDLACPTYLAIIGVDIFPFVCPFLVTSLVG